MLLLEDLELYDARILVQLAVTNYGWYLSRKTAFIRCCFPAIRFELFVYRFSVLNLP